MDREMFFKQTTRKEYMENVFSDNTICSHDMKTMLPFIIKTADDLEAIGFFKEEENE